MHKHHIRTVGKLFSFIKCTGKVVLSCFTTNTLHCLPMMQEPLPLTKGVIVFIKLFATVGYFPSTVPSSLLLCYRHPQDLFHSSSAQLFSSCSLANSILPSREFCSRQNKDSSSCLSSFQELPL